MEYWSFGVMGENRTGEYKPCFRAYRDMIIFLVKVIGQNKFWVARATHFDDLYMPGNAFSNTPTLQYSLGFNPGPPLGANQSRPSGLGFFTKPLYETTWPKFLLSI